MKKFKRITVGRQIAGGFGIILALLIILAAGSFLGIGSIVGNAGVVISGNQLNSILAQKEIEQLNWTKKLAALLSNDEIVTLDAELDHRKCAFGKWLYSDQRQWAEQLVPTLAPLLKKIEAPHRQLHESAIQITEEYHPVDHRLGWFLREKKSDHLDWMHEIKDVIFDPEETEIGVETDPRKCKLGRWIYFAETDEMRQEDPDLDRLITALESAHKQLHESVHKIQHEIEVGNKEAGLAVFDTYTRRHATETIAALDGIRDWHDSFVELEEDAHGIYAYEAMPALAEMQDLLAKIREETRTHMITDELMLSEAKIARTSIILIGSVALLLGVLLSFFISRGIIRGLRTISSQVDQSSVEVTTASQQVASASHALAGGASQQAGSIEETSASLEEMSAMTKENSMHARQADTLMAEANQLVADAIGTMTQLTDSMGDISEASLETSKIIKAIDEIAFQTNLLALNAAVEAARAGEAGAGFAVVADEVRNLAMRAAEAAKTTEELIEGTVKKVGDGAELVKVTNEAFTKMADSAAKVGELVGEIAAASSEQAQGIEQVSLAVTEMDKVTQQNAVNAEESAAASEELSAQAAQMKFMVGELTALVGGAGGREIRHLSEEDISKTKESTREPRERLESSTADAGKSSLDDQSTLVSPEQLIPLDDEDFKDF